MMNDYDVAIIGAGPSGCSCALALKDSGLRILLVDKEAFPRDKVCGDAIPGASFKAMDNINRELGDALRNFKQKHAIAATSVHTRNYKTINLSWKLYTYNCRRIDFDNFLLQLVKKETKTTIIENQRLEKVEVNPDYVTCKFQDGKTITASVVIGCDGANSIVRRQLDTVENKDKESFSAIRAYYKGIEGLQEGVNEVHLIDEADGYFWIFPLQDGWANVGFGVMKKKKRKEDPPRNLRATLEKIITSPSLISRFENAEPIGNMSGFGLPIWTKNRSLSGDRYILCGDAAFLIDPLQGHGIDNAMWSGIFAARQVLACFKEKNFNHAFMSQYDRAVYGKLGGELAKSYFLLKFLVKFPTLIDFFLLIKPKQQVINWFVRILKI